MSEGRPDARAGLWIGPLLAVFAGTLARMAQLSHTLVEEHSFRQTQTAWVAREYAVRGIDLSHTWLPVFGPTSDVPMEVPLVQAAASLLIRSGATADLAMRTAGLIGFQLAAVILVALALRWHGAAVALVAVVLWEFSPFGLAWGASSLIEFPAVAAALAMVWALDRWFSGGGWLWLLGGSICAWLAFAIKATTAPVWCVLVVAAAAATVLRHGWRRRGRRVAIGILTGPVAGAALAAVWTSYADGVKSAQPLTGFLTSSALREWNFGSLEQRLEPDGYAAIVSRIAGGAAGPLALALIAGVVAAFFAASGDDRVRRLAWAAAGASGPLVFFNLYAVHSYYLAAVYPAVVILLAFAVTGFAWLATRLGGPAWKVIATTAALSAVVASSWTSAAGRADLQQWLTSATAPPASAELASVLAPEDTVTMIGCDWDPTIAYYAERGAVMLRDGDDPAAGTASVSSGFLFACDGRDPTAYLDRSHAEPTGHPGLWRVVR